MRRPSLPPREKDAKTRWKAEASSENLQTSTKATFLETEQELDDQRMGDCKPPHGPVNDCSLSNAHGHAYLVTFDDERVRVEARVLECHPLVLTPTLRIHMGFHVAETWRNIIRVGGHSSKRV